MWIRRIVLAALGLAMLTVAGCEKALFTDELPRTPYTRYRQLRGREQPATVLNQFGGTEPDIRARLRPLEER